MNLEESYEWIKDHTEITLYMPLNKYDFKSDQNGNIDYYGKSIISLIKNMNDVEELPISFGKCSSGFQMSGDKLKSLKGVPREVYGFFDIHETNIKNLEYMPNKILGYLFLYKNKELDDYSMMVKPKEENSIEMMG